MLPSIDMISIRNVDLPTEAAEQLIVWQREIDDLPNYAERVAAAESNFPARKSRNNKTFKVVRTVLASMCSGVVRCGYCEDSAADEVEHIRPKSLYPEECFVWENYLYACGPCNGPKNNKFAVLNGSPPTLFTVARVPKAPCVVPRAGRHALIDPRREDPLEFMELDLLGTFFFIPIEPVGSESYVRAKYTIDVLRLNIRDSLVEARRIAFTSYQALLVNYVSDRESGKAKTQLLRIEHAVRRSSHRSVWKEMQRQHMASVLPLQQLRDLFDKAPEALKW